MELIGFVRVPNRVLKIAPHPEIIHDANQPSYPTLDKIFGDLFSRLWVTAKPSSGAQPRGNFLAQSRTLQPGSRTALASSRDPLHPLRLANAPYRPLPFVSSANGAPTQLQQGVARDWKLTEQIPRVNAFGFRGDTRSPIEVKASGGFKPPATRTDDSYIKGAMYNHFSAYLSKRHHVDISSISPDQFLSIVNQNVPNNFRSLFLEYTSWRTLMASEELHLGRMVTDEATKGYISTTYDVRVTRRFARAEGNYIYALRVTGAFVVPPLGGGHPWAVFPEAEMAQPGPITFDNVVGYRRLDARNLEPWIYVRQNLVQQSKPLAALLASQLGVPEL